MEVNQTRSGDNPKIYTDMEYCTPETNIKKFA